MNRSSFLELMKDPSGLSPETEPALRELLAEFPYFAAGHQLLARNYQLTGNYRFDKQLHLTAVQVPSRQSLYELLNTPALAGAEAEKQQASQVKEGVEIAEEHPLGTPAVEREEAPVAESELPEILPEPELPLASAGTASPEVEEITEEQVELPLAETTVEEAIVNLESALPGEDSQTLETIPQGPEMPGADIMEMPSPEELAGEVIEEPETEEQEDTEEHQGIPQPLEEPDLARAEEELISETEPHSFVEWLKWSAKHKPAETQTALTFAHAETTVAEPEKTAAEQPVAEEKQQQELIIDKFLKELPSISRPNASRFFKAEVAARESIMEDENLVSETLARLYARQGNIPKAIRIYEKLCLKYPDKKQIFATQIDELRQELNR